MVFFCILVLIAYYMYERKLSLKKSLLPCYCGFVVADVLFMSDIRANMFVLGVSCCIILMFAFLTDASLTRWLLCVIVYVIGMLLSIGDALRVGLLGSLWFVDLLVVLSVTLLAGILSWLCHRVVGLFRKKDH